MDWLQVLEQYCKALGLCWLARNGLEPQLHLCWVGHRTIKHPFCKCVALCAQQFLCAACLQCQQGAGQTKTTQMSRRKEGKKKKKQASLADYVSTSMPMQVLRGLAL